MHSYNLQSAESDKQMRAMVISKDLEALRFMWQSHNHIYGYRPHTIILDDPLSDEPYDESMHEAVRKAHFARAYGKSPQLQNLPRPKLNPLRRLWNMFTNRKLKEENSDLRDIIAQKSAEIKSLHDKIYVLQNELDNKDIVAFEQEIVTKGKYFIQLRTNDSKDPMVYSIYERKVITRNYGTGVRKTAATQIIGSYTELEDAEGVVKQLLEGEINFNDKK